jgi:hypothetical protein
MAVFGKTAMLSCSFRCGIDKRCRKANDTRQYKEMKALPEDDELTGKKSKEIVWERR